MVADDIITAARYLALLDRVLLAPNTHKGYTADWEFYCRWCLAQGFSSIPTSVETLSLFVAARLNEGRKVSTVNRNVAAVSHMHREAGLPSPATTRITDLLRAARRLRSDQLRQVRPLTVEQVRAIAELLLREDTAQACRDRALLIIGFGSALRSANLAALTLADVEFIAEGVTLQVRKSKTDQEGRGRVIGLPPGQCPATCPVDALKAWLARRGAWPGPVFTRFDGGRKERAIQPERIGQIVQQCVAEIGLDPKHFGSHSLRSGFVTEAGSRHVGELLIAQTTGHRNMTTLRSYFRPDLWTNNAAGMIGL